MSYVVAAELVGNVFSVEVGEGDAVAAGEAVVVLESMKMEIPVLAEFAGVVREIAVSKGDVVMEGDTLAVIEESK